MIMRSEIVKSEKVHNGVAETTFSLEHTFYDVIHVLLLQVFLQFTIFKAFPGPWGIL